jgi:hypothetical protein
MTCITPSNVLLRKQKNTPVYQTIAQQFSCSLTSLRLETFINDDEPGFPELKTWIKLCQTSMDFELRTHQSIHLRQCLCLSKHHSILFSSVLSFETATNFPPLQTLIALALHKTFVTSPLYYLTAIPFSQRLNNAPSAKIPFPTPHIISWPLAHTFVHLLVKCYSYVTTSSQTRHI